MGGMRITLEIPERLHAVLRKRAASAGVSMQSLVVEALERTYQVERKSGKSMLVTGPILKLKAKPGPRFPVDETPHDLIVG